MNIITRTLTVLFLISGLTQKAEGQFLRSPEIGGELTVWGGTSGEIPFWMLANRNGITGSGDHTGYLRLSAHLPLRQDRLFDYTAGVDFAARPFGQSTAFFNQLYLKVRYGPIHAYGGRMTETHGIHNPHLSSGSLGWSHNATPMPKIGIAIPDWLPLPYSRNFIAIRGHIAHGWFEEDRFTSSPWLHEKTGHVKFGGDGTFNVYGGILHYAVWGGDHPAYGRLPNQFKDFMHVFLVTGADDDAPPGDRNYMLGDHLGAWDFGFMLNLNRFQATVYRQFPLETKDNLKLKSPQDGLLGINIMSTDPRRLLSGLTYEFLYTKWQDGPRRQDPACPDPDSCRDGEKGNENYYNHYLYRAGWTYYGRTIGNPLFFPREDRLGIENNRIVAHHIGATGLITPAVTYRTLLTYSRNYGTYGTAENPRDESYPYYHGKEQFSFLLETRSLLPFLPDFYLIAGIAMDAGDLYPGNLGIMLGVSWGNQK